MADLQLFQLNNDGVLRLRHVCCGRNQGVAQLKRSIGLLNLRLRQLSIETPQQPHPGNEQIGWPNVQIAPVPAVPSCNLCAANNNTHSTDIFENYFLLVDRIPAAGQPQDEDQQRQAAVGLAVSLYNLALMRQLKNRRGLLHDSHLHSVATLYESAFWLLSHHPVRIQVRDSLALVALAICTNLCALYLKLGDLTKLFVWQQQLNQDQLQLSLSYHYVRNRQHVRHPNMRLQCIQITSTMQGMLYAPGAA